MEQDSNSIITKRFIEKEKIEIKYDYRTGRWNGDDYFKDGDGYGHYIGNYFEIWFNIYQTDFDHDGIPYWTEKNVLHTDPRHDDSNEDPDNDGIPTTWEWKWGYDPFITDDHKNLDPDIDGIENIEEYHMKKWFSDPFSQDIYIELDGMQKKGLFDRDYVLYTESQQIIIERFCENNINLYIDNGWSDGPNNGGGELLPYTKIISWDSGLVKQYYTHNFPDERKGIFRYLITCHSGAFPMISFSGNSDFNRYDTMVIGMEIYHILLAPRAQRLLSASTVLHELGHTLSISPYTIEGCDNLSLFKIKTMKDYIDEWGNYKSVMNYLYSANINIVDYSDGKNGYNDQNDWEKIYLPFFQIENNIICEPGIIPPAKEKVVIENLSVVIEGWKYSKEITEKYVKKISDWSPISPIKCNWSVLIKINNDSFLSNRNLRVYAWPNVPISSWSLIEEGYLLKTTNEIRFE